MSFASTSVSTGQDTSAIDDPLPETIPLPLTPPRSSSPGSAIYEAVVQTMKIPGGPEISLPKELVSLPDNEYKPVPIESTDYLTCGECNTCTP